jgi:putative transposase
MLSFKWRHFQKEIILLVVRWYLSYALGHRGLEETVLERGTQVDHPTINRWAVHYAPLFEEKFRRNYKRKVGSSWHMDETYIKAKGRWDHLYRAVDKEGNTVGFMLSEDRDGAAARAFFTKAIRPSGLPDKTTVDKSGANKAGIAAINLQLFVLSLLCCTLLQIGARQTKYLNNMVEQDHRGTKRITRPMMGLKAFHPARAALAGTRSCRMLKKGQHINPENIFAFEQFYALAA